MSMPSDGSECVITIRIKEPMVDNVGEWLKSTFLGLPHSRFPHMVCYQIHRVGRTVLFSSVELELKLVYR